MCGIEMKGQSDLIELFASPPSLAVKMGLRSSIVVLKDVISNSKKRLFITCYEFSSKKLTEKLIETAKRGVWIDLYVDESETGPSPNRITRSKKNLEKMEEAGIRVVRLNNPMRNHTKAIIADSKIGVIGSANFTYAGLHTNIEVGILLKGRTCRIFVEKFISGLEGMIDDG